MNDPVLQQRPIMFCYDGSPGSRNAMRQAGQSLRPAPALVVTAWQTVVVRLQTTAGLSGAGMIFDPAEAEGDEERAAEHGFDTSHFTVQAGGQLRQALVTLADKNDAALIVCGAKGALTDPGTDVRQHVSRHSPPRTPPGSYRTGNR